MDAAFAFAEPDQRKQGNLPEAIDLSHHLNLLARSRTANSLKGLYRYAGVPGMVSLAGGLPNPTIFPFASISAEIYPPDALAKKPPTLTGDSNKDTVKEQSFLSWLFGKKPTKTITIPKNPEEAKGNPNAVDLSTLLQYSSAEGHPALKEFIRNFVEKVYQPGYADWQVQVNVGASAGWNQVVNMLMERGDAILIEEFSYPGAMNSYQPLDIKQYAVKIDGEGLIPEDFDRILSTWDEKKEGRKRPRVLYTVPTGQNPTGGTMLAKRKKIIYDLCVKYDVIIVEDEPYYFLYADPWVPQAGKANGQALRAYDNFKDEKKGVEEFFKKLPPSYLKFDYQGRVIRLDTFSKTLAPGSRLGWFTTSPLFAERLLRGCESMISTPNGFGQAVVTKLMLDWGYDGYIRWLRGIKATYAMRRDWMCDLLENIFHLEFDQKIAVSDNIQWVTAYEKIAPGMGASVMDEKRGYKSRLPMVSFVPPSAGMFVWLAVHLENHKDFYPLQAKGEDAARVLIEKLWVELAENKVLLAPGYIFDGQPGVPHEGAEKMGFFRLAFSSASQEEMKTSITTMGRVLVAFFK